VSNRSLNFDCGPLLFSSPVSPRFARMNGTIYRVTGRVSSSWRILTCSSYWHRSGTRACRDSEGRTCSSRCWRSSGSAYSSRFSAWRISSRPIAWSVKPWGSHSSNSSATPRRISLFYVSTYFLEECSRDRRRAGTRFISRRSPVYSKHSSSDRSIIREIEIIARRERDLRAGADVKQMKHLTDRSCFALPKRFRALNLAAWHDIRS